jgi:predicted DNA-binding transcriptional regulator AlpA
MNYRPEATGRATFQGLSTTGVDDDRVISFIEWCDLNGFSRSTGQRLIASGKGPRFIQLSEKRKGVTVGENRRWQQSRLIETAA